TQWHTPQPLAEKWRNLNRMPKVMDARASTEPLAESIRTSRIGRAPSAYSNLHTRETRTKGDDNEEMDCHDRGGRTARPGPRRKRAVDQHAGRRLRRTGPARRRRGGCQEDARHADDQGCSAVDRDHWRGAEGRSPKGPVDERQIVDPPVD